MDGSLAVVMHWDTWDMWVVDLKAQRFLHKLQMPESGKASTTPRLAIIAPDNERFIQRITRSHEEFKTKDKISYPVIWNLRTGSSVCCKPVHPLWFTNSQASGSIITTYMY